MPSSAPVELSVVLLSYNRLELTRKAVANILGDTRFVDFELIVVDNASMDGTREFLESITDPRVRVVLLDHNRYFGGGNNAGIRECRGEYVLLTQNDMTFAPHSFAALLDMSRYLPNAGCVGIGGGFLSKRGKIFEVSDWYLNPIRQFDYMPVDFNSGCCMLFKRDFMLANDIHFDEQYRLYWEDVDICHQVVCAGRAIYMLNNGLVGTRHLRSATITPLLGVEERERIRSASEAYYREKWRPFYNEPEKFVPGIQYRYIWRSLRLVPTPLYQEIAVREEVKEHNSDAEEIAPYEYLEIQQDYEAAIAGYKETVKRNPNNFLAYRNLCRAVTHSKSAERLDEVIPLVRAFLRSRPPVVLRSRLFRLIEPELTALAGRLTREGRLQEALDHYQEIYEIAPNAHSIAICEVQIAKLKHRLGHSQEAERRLTEWLVKNELQDLPACYFSSAHFYLGEIAAAKADYPMAVQHFSSALDIEPDHVRAAERLHETRILKEKGA